jgi:copper chaperone CopZ
VELKGVHLCCGKCIAGVKKALTGIEGVQYKCDQEAKTVTITAKDDAAAQKALDALAATAARAPAKPRRSPSPACTTAAASATPRSQTRLRAWMA